MTAAVRNDREYVVPTYRAPAGTTWYHFLLGNVPGHQIDFIYRPEVPQGPLTQQHFSHLARLLKYIEPRADSPCAFAIGNLSRDDTQYEPGHGAIALILGLRVRGAMDHNGRRDPVFTHGIAAVNRQVEPAAIARTAMQFHRHLLGDPGDEGSGALRGMYSRFCEAAPAGRLPVLKGYVKSFSDLPALERSKLRFKWSSRVAPQRKRVVIVHPDDASFGELVEVAARIAYVLAQSDLRWTSITTGREEDIPNGMSIRLVPRRELRENDAESLVIPLEQMPGREAELAQQLFGLVPTERARVSGPPPVWREVAKAQGQGTLEIEHIGSAAVPVGGDVAEQSIHVVQEDAPPSADAGAFAAGSVGGPVEPSPRPQSRRRGVIGFAVALVSLAVIGGAFALGLGGRTMSNASGASATGGDQGLPTPQNEELSKEALAGSVPPGKENKSIDALSQGKASTREPATNAGISSDGSGEAVDGSTTNSKSVVQVDSRTAQTTKSVAGSNFAPSAKTKKKPFGGKDPTW